MATVWQLNAACMNRHLPGGCVKEFEVSYDVPYLYSSVQLMRLLLDVPGCDSVLVCVKKLDAFKHTLFACNPSNCPMT